MEGDPSPSNWNPAPAPAPWPLDLPGIIHTDINQIPIHVVNPQGTRW